MNKEKLLKLVQIVDDGLQLRDLHRLVDGDLSHIGDALVQGKEVNVYGTKARSFSGAAEIYKIIDEPRITVGSVSFPKPVTESLNYDDVYWLTSITSSGSMAIRGIWRGDSIDLNRLKLGVVHLTKESAIEHAKALVKINRGEF